MAKRKKERDREKQEGSKGRDWEGCSTMSFSSKLTNLKITLSLDSWYDNSKLPYY